MRDSLLSGRFVRAIIGVVAALSGLVSGCPAQSLNLQVVTTLELRLTAVRVQPSLTATPQTDEMSDVPLAPEPKKRLEPTAFVLSAFEAFAGKTQIDGRPGSPSAQPVTPADTPAAGNSGAGNGQPEEPDGFRWQGAVRQSLFFLGILHGVRMAVEPESQAGLKGPFFKDYFATVKNLRGWRDGDRFIVNYVAHPMQGAVSGYVQIHNDPKATRQELGMSKSYWNSRLKAMGWAALFSTQFELGPISEASLGNVGLNQRDNTKHPMAWIDLIVTPTVGTAWLVGEDALDRYVVRLVEAKVSNRVIRLLVRSFLNPSRSMSNVLRLKYPWHRDNRTLGP
ncbi:MAG: hypothetical protein AABN34_10375 [Acidobacteriota bacterium]